MAALFFAFTSCTRGESRGDAPAGATSALAPLPTVEPLNAQVSQRLERHCRQICDKSLRLACSNAAACLPNCLAMGSATPCTPEFESFYECMVAEPIDHWECAPDGVAAIRDGYCDREQERTLACMESKMAK